MISSHEIIELIKGFSLKERLLIIEEILRNIREENTSVPPTDNKNSPAILDLAGVIDEDEAEVFTNAVNESRQIDEDEW